MSERRTPIAPALQVNRYSQAVPRPRKIWLVAVGFSCIINLILIVVALVSPTPQFASNVLFRLKTIESASFTRRWFPPEPVDGDEDREPILTTLPPQPDAFGLAGPVKRSDDWISEDWNVECKVDREQYLCRGWDPSLGTWQTQGPSTAQPMSTEATTAEATTTVLSDSLTTSPPTMTRTSRPLVSPTTRTGSTAPRPSPSVGGNDTLPGDFVTLWIGPMGACVEKKDLFRICSQPSFTPKFQGIYDQSGLTPDIVAILPDGTSGGSLMLLFALMAYCIAVVAFAVAYRPATRARTREGNRSYSNARYVWLLAIATAANTAGVVAVLISLIVFQNTFKGAIERVPELPYELIAEAGGGALPLYVSVVFGIISTAAGVIIVLDDLKLVLREAVEARARREARQEKARKAREKKQARGGPRRHRRRVSSRSGTRGDDGESGDEEAALRQAQYAHGLSLSDRTVGNPTGSVPGQADLVEEPHAHVRFASAPQSAHGQVDTGTNAAAQLESRNRYADRSERRPVQSRSRSASFLGELPRWMPGSGAAHSRPSMGIRRQRTTRSPRALRVLATAFEIE